MGTRQGCGAGSSAWRIVANSVPCRAEQLGHGHCNRAFSGVGERLDSPRFRTAGLFGLKPHDVLVRPARVPGHTSSSGTAWRTGLPASSVSSRSAESLRCSSSLSRCPLSGTVHMSRPCPYVRKISSYISNMDRAPRDSKMSGALRRRFTVAASQKSSKKVRKKWHICCCCDRCPLRPCND